MIDHLARYYTESDEAGRLYNGSGLLEFARSKEIISRYLPQPPSRILDIGGGPGEYSGWLSSLGFEVYLLDPVEKHLKQAGRYPLAGVQMGDARALPYLSGVADAVLLMGPLYHLTDRTDRALALGEAHRVIRPGGLLFASAISHWASAMHSLVDGFLDDDEFWPLVQRDLSEGQHRNDTGNPLYFTTSVFHKPGDLREELAAANFADIELLAIEGPGWLARDFDARWSDPHRRERLLALIRLVERDEALLGASMHLMAVARRL